MSIMPNSNLNCYQKTNDRKAAISRGHELIRGQKPHQKHCTTECKQRPKEISEPLSNFHLTKIYIRNSFCIFIFTI